MPEYPDFEHIARQTANAVSKLSSNALTVFLAEQLRVMWNARGAADIAKIDAEVPGASTKVLNRAIRSLDR